MGFFGQIFEIFLMFQLISSVGQASRYRATSIGSGLKSDPHGSVIVTDADADNIQLHQLGIKGNDLN